MLPTLQMPCPGGPGGMMGPWMVGWMAIWGILGLLLAIALLVLIIVVIARLWPRPPAPTFRANEPDPRRPDEPGGSSGGTPRP